MKIWSLIVDWTAQIANYGRENKKPLLVNIILTSMKGQTVELELKGLGHQLNLPEKEPFQYY